jgi:hypothetical protein
MASVDADCLAAINFAEDTKCNVSQECSFSGQFISSSTNGKRQPLFLFGQYSEH